MAETHLSGGAAATPRGLPQPRYSDAELTCILRWQESDDRRRLARRKRQSRPGRNVGPFGCKHAWGDLPQRSTWHVVHDVPLAGGTTFADGVVIPEVGGFIRAEPVAPPCSSRGQGLKCLKRARRRIPDAYLVRFTRIMTARRGPSDWVCDQQVCIARIEVNEGAPEGWWQVRATPAATATEPEKLR